MSNLVLAIATIVLAKPALAQGMPADYAAVLKTLGPQGDFKEGIPESEHPQE